MNTIPSNELIVMEYSLDFGEWIPNWSLTKSLTVAEKRRLSEDRAALNPELDGSVGAEKLPRIRLVHCTFLPMLDPKSAELDPIENLEDFPANSRLFGTTEKSE